MENSHSWLIPPAMLKTIALHERVWHWVIGYRRFLANLGFVQRCATPTSEDDSAAKMFVKQGMGPDLLHYEGKYLYVHDQSFECVQDRYRTLNC